MDRTINHFCGVRVFKSREATLKKVLTMTYKNILIFNKTKIEANIPEIEVIQNKEEGVQGWRIKCIKSALQTHVETIIEAGEFYFHNHQKPVINSNILKLSIFIKA